MEAAEAEAELSLHSLQLQQALCLCPPTLTRVAEQTGTGVPTKQTENLDPESDDNIVFSQDAP